MKNCLAFVLFWCACTQPVSQKEAKKDTITTNSRKAANDTERSILKSADSMMVAFTKRDWPAFTLFINPAMVDVMGGKENMAYMLKQQMIHVPDSIIKQARVERILQVVKVDDELQCVVEQKIIMQQNNRRITSTNYLVGRSLNDGNSWTFFDASNKGELKPTDILPTLSPQLIIPAKQQETTTL